MYVQTAEPRIASVPTKAELAFWLSLGGAVVVKSLAAGLFPLTGDEAYFIQWGRQLAGSYYDHGPVTGWLLWLLLQFGDAVAWLRLPAIIFPAAVSFLLYRAWRSYDQERALLVASVMAWSLPSVLGILMTTDTPLQLFAVAAVVVAARAEQTDRPVHYVAAGALLGVAFLAKYFAVLIGVGLAIWWLVFSRPARWYAVGYLLLGVAPFAAQHVYWNIQHSWTNVMFNVFTRNSEARVSLAGPLMFLGMAVWLFGPVALALWRRKRVGRSVGWRSALQRVRQSVLGIYLVTFASAWIVLFLVSFVRPVGLHWLVSFYPLAFAALLIVFKAVELERLLAPVMWFSFAHLAVGLALILLPVEWVKSHRSYPSIVLGMFPHEVLAAAQPYRDQDHLATPSYARSALLEYYAEERVRVLGPGSFHGRQDDLRTNWRELDGHNFVFITANPADAPRLKGWFRDVHVHPVEVRAARLYVITGRGFDYRAYREQVLAPVAARYYTKPGWLERVSDGCFFRERYDL